jgi:hypothetical protein
MAKSMKVTRDGDTVTVTMAAAKAEGLRDELLWVKNVDEDGPTMKLWKALSRLLPDDVPSGQETSGGPAN